VTQLPSEISVTVIFEHREENRYYIHSPHIPGLHLAGPKLEELNALLETTIRDLLYYKSNIFIDGIRWVPSLDDVTKQLSGTPQNPPAIDNKTYLISVHAAA
jgi:hypothetical protein